MKNAPEKNSTREHKTSNLYRDCSKDDSFMGCAFSVLRFDDTKKSIKKTGVVVVNAAFYTHALPKNYLCILLYVRLYERPAEKCKASGTIGHLYPVVLLRLNPYRGSPRGSDIFLELKGCRADGSETKQQYTEILIHTFVVQLQMRYYGSLGDRRPADVCRRQRCPEPATCCPKTGKTGCLVYPSTKIQRSTCDVDHPSPVDRHCLHQAYPTYGSSLMATCIVLELY